MDAKPARAAKDRPARATPDLGSPESSCEALQSSRRSGETDRRGAVVRFHIAARERQSGDSA